MEAITGVWERWKLDNGDRYGCPAGTAIDLNGNDKKALQSSQTSCHR